jgi:nucleotide-binding universal stress UspA family protein
MVTHFVIAVDGSAPSRRAAVFGYGLAEQTKSQVTLVSVLRPPEIIPVGPLSGYLELSPPATEAYTKQVHELLRTIAAEHPAVKSTLLVETGAVSDTICEVAKRVSADLIVVGARGQNPAMRLLTGSVSDQVARHAHCPVTIWR